MMVFPLRYRFCYARYEQLYVCVVVTRTCVAVIQLFKKKKENHALIVILCSHSNSYTTVSKKAAHWYLYFTVHSPLFSREFTYLCGCRKQLCWFKYHGGQCYFSAEITGEKYYIYGR